MTCFREQKHAFGSGIMIRRDRCGIASPVPSAARQERLRISFSFNRAALINMAGRYRPLFSSKTRIL